LSGVVEIQAIRIEIGREEDGRIISSVPDRSRRGCLAGSDIAGWIPSKTAASWLLATLGKDTGLRPEDL
jgi:hypothetical protein